MILSCKAIPHKGQKLVIVVLVDDARGGESIRATHIRLLMMVR
jgi:hypothetical protein